MSPLITRFFSENMPSFFWPFGAVADALWDHPTQSTARMQMLVQR